MQAFAVFTNKHAELEAFLSRNDIDILLGSESHHENAILNSEIFSNSYTVYRKDRNRQGGGVFIMTRHSFPTSEITLESPLEILWVKMHINNHDELVIGSFYCPPNSLPTIFDDLVQNFINIKEKHPHTKIIIGGDLV